MFIGCWARLEWRSTSAHCRRFPAIARIASLFRRVPFWAKSTPEAALIFNNATEKLGVL